MKGKLLSKAKRVLFIAKDNVATLSRDDLARKS